MSGALLFWIIVLHCWSMRVPADDLHLEGVAGLRLVLLGELLPERRGVVLGVLRGDELDGGDLLGAVPAAGAAGCRAAAACRRCRRSARGRPRRLPRRGRSFCASWFLQEPLVSDFDRFFVDSIGNDNAGRIRGSRVSAASSCPLPPPVPPGRAALRPLPWQRTLATPAASCRQGHGRVTAPARSPGRSRRARPACAGGGPATAPAGGRRSAGRSRPPTAAAGSP